MNNINMLNVPSDCRLFCLVNYNAFAELVDKNGFSRFADLPLLTQPIIAANLEEARFKLADILKVPAHIMTEWEVIGEENNFSPSLNIGFESPIMVAGYSFDVYTTVNTLHLLEG